MAKEIGIVAYRKNGAQVAFIIMNPSSSSNKTWKTVVYEDGSISCNCPGWTKHANRQCKHTIAAQQKIQLKAQLKAVRRRDVRFLM